MPHLKSVTRISTAALLVWAMTLQSTVAVRAQTLSDPGGAGGLLYNNATGDGGITGLFTNFPSTPDEVFDAGKGFTNDVSSLMGHVLDLAPNISPGAKNVMSAFQEVDKNIVGGIGTALKTAEFAGATDQERKQMLWSGAQSQYSDSLSAAVGAATTANLAASGASLGVATAAGIAAGLGITAAAALYFKALNDKIAWLLRPASTHDLGLQRVGNQMCHVTATTRLPRQFTCALRINRPDDPKSVAFSLCNDIERTCFDIPDPKRSWEPDASSPAASALKNGGISPKGSGMDTEGWYGSMMSSETGTKIVGMANIALDRANDAVDFERVSGATADFIANGYDAQAYALQELVAALVLLYMLEEIYAEMEENPSFESDLISFVKSPDNAPAIMILKESDAAYDRELKEMKETFNAETRSLIKELKEQQASELAALKDQVGETFSQQRNAVAARCEAEEMRFESSQAEAVIGKDRSEASEIKRGYRAELSELKRTCRAETSDIKRAEAAEVREQSKPLKSQHRDEIRALETARKDELAALIDEFESGWPSAAFE